MFLTLRQQPIYPSSSEVHTHLRERPQLSSENGACGLYGNYAASSAPAVCDNQLRPTTYLGALEYTVSVPNGVEGALACSMRVVC